MYFAALTKHIVHSFYYICILLELENMEKKPDKKVVVGISHGDFNGISYEIILKTFSDRRMYDFCTPVLYGSSRLVSYFSKTHDLPQLGTYNIKKGEKPADSKFNVANVFNQEARVEVGNSTQEAGKSAFDALESATEDLGKTIDVLVTAPINKDNIQSEEFTFPGHTEYLAKKFNSTGEMMILASKLLKVGVVTGHLPLRDVADSINGEKLMKKIKILHNSLKRDFGIRKPRIAVLGLNPHAGDNGLLGKEEQEIIIPTLEKARAKGILCFGPYAADGFFGTAQYRNFDAVLAMYHDQALAPFKALSFEDGVNFTTGLSYVRTSPAHGTAYGIAGKNQADPSSFREAIFMAIEIFNNRKTFDSINKNPLEITYPDNVGDTSASDLEDRNAPRETDIPMINT